MVGAARLLACADRLVQIKHTCEAINDQENDGYLLCARQATMMVRMKTSRSGACRATIDADGTPLLMASEARDGKGASFEYRSVCRHHHRAMIDAAERAVQCEVVSDEDF